MTLKILLSGATGAMGRRIEALAEQADDLEIAGRASRGGFFDGAEGDLVVDFSGPQLCRRSLELARAHGLPMVVGTTGLDADLESALDDAAGVIPVFRAANFSLGVHVLIDLAARAAAALGPEFDIEITDIHHRRKVDSPSGTALAIGEVLARARNLDPATSIHPDAARGPRRPGEIGFQAVRGGDVVGEHRVQFLGDGERLEIVHRATDRTLFARGALQAARWLAGRPPGLYRMSDLLEG